MKKPRNKKYNPNKLLPSQVKQLQRAAQDKKDISETYEMSMEFISSHVRDFIEDKKIGEKSLLDKFPHAETLPYHFTIGAYDYQDLSIALILGHGLRKVGWLGLDQEIIKEIESKKNIPNDFGIEQIQVLIEADIKFINTKCYQEFLAVAEWVNAGHELAEDRLRKLWIADQVLGGRGETIGYEGAA